MQVSKEKGEGWKQTKRRGEILKTKNNLSVSAKKGEPLKLEKKQTTGKKK